MENDPITDAVLTATIEATCDVFAREVVTLRTAIEVLIAKGLVSSGELTEAMQTTARRQPEPVRAFSEFLQSTIRQTAREKLDAHIRLASSPGGQA